MPGTLKPSVLDVYLWALALHVQALQDQQYGDADFWEEIMLEVPETEPAAV